MSIQIKANNIWGILITCGDSLALADIFVLGSPKKDTPNTLVKHAVARPPISASAIMPNVDAANSPIELLSPLKPPIYIKSSLTNPLNGGIPDIAREPMRKARLVVGILFIKPPISSKECVPVDFITAPAPMNNNDLNSA